MPEEWSVGMVHFPLSPHMANMALVRACVHLQFVVTQELGGFPWLFPNGDLFTN